MTEPAKRRRSSIAEVAEVLALILKRSKLDPIKANKIEELTGISYRTVSLVVAAATRRGIPIASGTNGYYQATPEEVQGHLQKEKGRALDLLDKVKQAESRQIGQVSIFETLGKSPDLRENDPTKKLTP